MSRLSLLKGLLKNWITACWMGFFFTFFTFLLFYWLIDELCYRVAPRFGPVFFFKFWSAIFFSSAQVRKRKKKIKAEGNNTKRPKKKMPFQVCLDRTQPPENRTQKKKEKKKERKWSRGGAKKSCA